MRKFLFLVFALPLPAADKPNILFILADDLGINDLSCEGSTFHETPNIDAIAKSGTRFTNGYSTCQVCSPSRASIMSGQYPARIGITDWIGAATGTNWKRNDRILPPENGAQLPAKITTVAEALKSGGYRTFFAGKWHLGGEGSGPEDHGFEVNKGGYHSGSPRGGYFSPSTTQSSTTAPPAKSCPSVWQRKPTTLSANKNPRNRSSPSFPSTRFTAPSKLPLIFGRSIAKKRPPPDWSKSASKMTAPSRSAKFRTARYMAA